MNMDVRRRALRQDAQALDRMGALLHDEDAWVQEDYALDARGLAVEPDSVDARCWCMIGALRAVTSDAAQVDRLARRLVEPAYPTDLPDVAVFTFNDAPERQHGDVLAVIKKASLQVRAELVALDAELVALDG